MIFASTDWSIIVCIRVDVFNFMSDRVSDIPLLLAWKQHYQFGELDTITRIGRFIAVLAFQYHDLSTNCFFANFVTFNKRSKLALVLMMQLTTARPKAIVGESVLRFIFSMETFMKVCGLHNSTLPLTNWIIFVYFQVVKTSYSYVTLMRHIK